MVGISSLFNISTKTQLIYFHLQIHLVFHKNTLITLNKFCEILFYLK